MRRPKAHHLLLLILLIGLTLRIIAALRFQAMAAEYIGYDESVYYSLARHMGESGPLAHNLMRSTLFFQDYVVWTLKTHLFHHPPLFVWLLYL
jgi:hypothetical protein